MGIELHDVNKATAYQHVRFVPDMRDGMILLMGVDPAVALLIKPVHFLFEPQLTWLLCLARLARLAGYT